MTQSLWLMMYQHSAALGVDKVSFNIFISKKCRNPWVRVSLKKLSNGPQFLFTSASIPPKILPFLLAIPQGHSGTQSREETGNEVTTISDVLAECSSWAISFQEFVVLLNSAILEGRVLFESLPPKARIRSPILTMACLALLRDCSKSRTLTTSWEVML